MIFYLKVNRNNSYVIPNLKHWLDAVMLYEGGFAYILCDNPELKQRIMKELTLNPERTEFLESDRNCCEINGILDNICGGNKWVKVGQAHLKTHWHACEKQYPYFWNIDADDTYVCLDPIRMAEMFRTVEKYSVDNSIRMISLDMWRSMSVEERWPKGNNWSLGIVFVDNQVSWPMILETHCLDKEFQKRTFPLDKDINLDWYFTYLRSIKAERIETFYFENMRFMHFYDYFINFPHLSSFCYWKEGKLHYPILASCFGSRSRTEIEIAPDIHKLDMDITDDEALLSLVSSSNEVFSFWFDLRDKRLEVGDLMKKRCEFFLKKMKKTKIICWGAGAAFYRNYELIKKAYDLEYVCDSDSDKWGKTLIDDVKCISPDDLQRDKEEVFVLVVIDSPGANHKIIHKLIELGIYSFDHYDNWIEFVTGAVDF